MCGKCNSLWIDRNLYFDWISRQNVTISNDAFDEGFGEKKMMNFSTDIVVVLL